MNKKATRRPRPNERGKRMMKTSKKPKDNEDVKEQKRALSWESHW